MNEWPNFSDAELNCQCCGDSNPNIEFVELMDLVQELRDELGFPLRVTSAYRCPDHPIESKKDKFGMHNTAAIDINVHHEQALQLVELALAKGFTGIGINQKGSYNSRFIHLDLREGARTLWTY
ncbi:endolysin [Vibrio phage 1.097.O._10N.286.49.B3]|uniref:Peptidase M15 n=1 Tax=Vibrio phage 1.097.O._10N.286.49.B3 TaxID=1881383 RepID=A0A2I7R0I8_9CAUD|nr:endolysin [Vibrio phage 1.097.O._10N.286.49.B3]AUR87164.1 peptidase M15 [Vibrio phage 1.097.O._10N.286.49.B3]